jgi:hypothetical protein
MESLKSCKDWKYSIGTEAGECFFHSFPFWKPSHWPVKGRQCPLHAACSCVHTEKGEGTNTIWVAADSGKSLPPARSKSPTAFWDLWWLRGPDGSKRKSMWLFWRRLPLWTDCGLDDVIAGDSGNTFSTTCIPKFSARLCSGDTSCLTFFSNWLLGA